MCRRERAFRGGPCYFRQHLVGNTDGKGRLRYTEVMDPVPGESKRNLAPAIDIREALEGPVFIVHATTSPRAVLEPPTAILCGLFSLRTSFTSSSYARDDLPNGQRGVASPLCSKNSVATRLS